MMLDFNDAKLQQEFEDAARSASKSTHDHAHDARIAWPWPGQGLQPNCELISQHLYALFPPEFVHRFPDAEIEVVYGPPGNLSNSRWFNAFNLRIITDFVEVRNACGDNIYVGAALRQGPMPDKGRGKTENFLAASCCWIEYDDDGDAERVDVILKDKKLKPEFVITTGTTPWLRQHIYFRIKDGIGDPIKLKAANRALRDLLRTDDVTDAIRVMRLAGCVNTPDKNKRERGYVPEVVTVQVAQVQQEYAIDELIALCRPAGASTKKQGLDFNDAGSRQSPRDDDELFALLEASHVTGKWHNSMRDAIASMVGRGWNDDAIRFCCAAYCEGGKDDHDLDPLIDGARQKWSRPDIGDPGSNRASNSAATGAGKLTYFGEFDTSANKRPILKGLMYKGEISSLIGPPKSLKSALITEIIVHCAECKDWRGHRAKERVGVVIFALERADLYRRRLEAYRLRDRLEKLPIAVKGGVIDLLDFKCVQSIVTDVREAERHMGCDVGIIVIDTYSKGIAAGGGDENSAKDQNRVAANLRRVLDLIDVHIATVGHTGKDQSRGERGSNARLGDVDVQIQIIVNGKVKTAKVTDANDQPDRVIARFESELFELGRDDDGDPKTVAIISSEATEPSNPAAPKRRLNAAQSRAMELLTRCINDLGRPAPPTEEYPRIIRVVSLQEWHTMCERCGLSSAEKKTDRDKAFRRAKDDLQTLNRIACLDGLVWLVRNFNDS